MLVSVIMVSQELDILIATGDSIVVLLESVVVGITSPVVTLTVLKVIITSEEFIGLGWSCLVEVDSVFSVIRLDFIVSPMLPVNIGKLDNIE